MRRSQRTLLPYLILIILFSLIGTNFLRGIGPQPETMNFRQVFDALKEDQVETMALQGDVLTGVLRGEDSQEFRITIPLTNDVVDQIINYAEVNDIDFETNPPEGRSIWIELLPTIITLVIMMGLLYFMFSNAQGGTNKAMSFGKSKAKLIKQGGERRITFADVAGLKEEKEELFELVDFLKNPQKFAKIGARIPKGILMVGLPGTGKTYLSRAVAGEAGVPFYSISGSDFVEMFVGVGASRVRDLFTQAKKDAPCIIFIDEIDAVGRRRGAGLGGGNDEREQTLNQLLVEMDGFGDHQGIIIIAATNRPDILDPALLRPGRFDRQVQIGIPDVKERVDMLKVHSKNKPMAADIDFEVIAKRTPGFTPADLENIMNEAALLTARKNKTEITMPTLEEAITKVIVGVEKKSKVITPKEKRLVSVHEAGHALVTYHLPNVDPVHMVTIIPRGGAGGFTMSLPEDEKNYMTKEQLQNMLAVMLGGRAAEKVVLKDITTGASNDLKHVTDIARNMVVKYAMSENLPQMAFSEEENVFIANDIMTRRDHSERLVAEIDREIQTIVDHAYETALKIVEDNEVKLEELAKALVEYETLDDRDFILLMEEGYDALQEKIEADKAKTAPKLQPQVA